MLILLLDLGVIIFKRDAYQHTVHFGNKGSIFLTREQIGIICTNGVIILIVGGCQTDPLRAAALSMTVSYNYVYV